MDREALKGLAKGRRNSSEPAVAPRKVTWTCEYCQHPFVSERVFMNHRCKEKERLEELRGLVGQSAYAYYSEWMKQSKRSVPPLETFAHSSFYSTFIKFANHVRRVNMPNPMGFIKIMVSSNIQPSLWCRDNVYALYLQSYDTAVPPTTQFIDSLDFALWMAGEHEVQPAEVFSAMGLEKVLLSVQKRKLSPWFLVASKKFREWMAAQNEWDKSRLEGAVQVGAMIMRIQQTEKHIKLFKEFSKATEEAGL